MRLVCLWRVCSVLTRLFLSLYFWYVWMHVCVYVYVCVCRLNSATRSRVLGEYHSMDRPSATEIPNDPFKILLCALSLLALSLSVMLTLWWCSYNVVGRCDYRKNYVHICSTTQDYMWLKVRFSLIFNVVVFASSSDLFCRMFVVVQLMQLHMDDPLLEAHALRLPELQSLIQVRSTTLYTGLRYVHVSSFFFLCACVCLCLVRNIYSGRFALFQVL